LKLNPEKCVFGVQKGKVLGFLISVKGIEAIPGQCNSTHEASAIQKGGLEAHRKNHNAESVHVKAGRAKLTILHHP
jgi:hypothetical protein